MHIHGKERTPVEVRRFVHEHKAAIEREPSSRYHVLLELVRRPLRLLDYGCGWGTFSKMLEERGHDVTGIDLGENEIRICRAAWGESERLSFSNKRITDIAESSYECVVSTQVIEHVHNPGTYLHEINRVLESGGRLVISVPNAATPRHAFPLVSPRLKQHLALVSEETRTRYDKAHHHIQAWDPVHFVRLVSTVGFEFEEYRPHEGIPMPNLPFVPAYTGGRLLPNFSYSMSFSFRKVADSAIGPYD